MTLRTVSVESDSIQQKEPPHLTKVLSRGGQGALWYPGNGALVRSRRKMCICIQLLTSFQIDYVYLGIPQIARWSLIGLCLFIGWEKVTVIGPYYYPRPLRKNWITLTSETFHLFLQVQVQFSEAFHTSTCFSLLQMLPTMHYCSKKSFTGICGKRKKFWPFARSRSFLTHFFPFGQVPFLTTYVFFFFSPFLPLLAEPPEALGAAGRIVIPLLC